MKIQKVISLVPEKWKIDGGVAFGIVPKSLWGKWYPSDEQNLIPMVNRCLLLETDKRLILINTGFGNKRDQKYYQFKYFTERISLVELLLSHGYNPSDITDVIFTHLHDDHCGGAVEKINNAYYPIFPNARHWVTQKQLDHFFWAKTREKATFFEDNILPLLQKKILFVVRHNDNNVADLKFILSDGHTPGQLLPLFTWNNSSYLYASDFIPSLAHISPTWCAAVDLFPLIAMQEKEKFLQQAFQKNIHLFFEHDAFHQTCQIIKNEKGFTGIVVNN